MRPSSHLKARRKPGTASSSASREPSRFAAATMAAGCSDFASILACSYALRTGTVRGPGPGVLLHGCTPACRNSELLLSPRPALLTRDEQSFVVRHHRERPGIGLRARRVFPAVDL